MTAKKRAKHATRSKQATRAKRAKRAKVKKAPSSLPAIVQAALEDMKAVNIQMFDVTLLTYVTDTVFVTSGTSDRHVRSIAERVVEAAKKAGYQPLGIEGAREGEWVLVDLNEVVCHVMLPRTRELYALEQLWDTPTPAMSAAAPPAPRRRVSSRTRSTTS
ncbi:MAG: ribosome silencing factor [Pseudomonadales bacterium]|jgi:ribosome-associated protein|nr:ribosome silencing factor [Pseudomonadales bacterium]